MSLPPNAYPLGDGWWLVGEQGPELIDLPRGSRVVPYPKPDEES